MKRNIASIILLSVFTLVALSQSKVYDPTLDRRVTMVQDAHETWESRYMWYPGQLAAYYQQQCAQISKNRCVHVSYPGKFFASNRHAYFKTEIKVNQPSCLIQWASPATTTLYLDGKKCETQTSQVELRRGKHTIVFEVLTDHGLPCIMLRGAGLENPDIWRVSMDNNSWTLPESDAAYNKPDQFPDVPLEVVAQIRPSSILTLRNAQDKGTAGIRIGKNGMVLLDFYHLEVGALTFRAKGRGTVTVRVGETPEEALDSDTLKMEQFPLKPLALSADEQTFTLPQRALRYVSLECDKGASVSSIRFDASVWPVQHLMEFKTDDEYVTNLFRMSRATLHTSMHRFYLDGVKRDYLPWSMDALLSTFGGDYLFGDQQMSKNGISIAFMPLNPQLSDLGIPDYPLHALVGLKQNYLRYGDLATSLQYKQRVIQLLDFYTSIVDKDGFLHGQYEKSSFGFTPGWSTPNGPESRGIATYAQIMLYYNYETGAYFAHLWNEKALAKKYHALATRLKAKIFEHFWDKEKQAFVNGTLNDGLTLDKRISHHAQYWAILADLFPKEAYDNLFERVLPNLPRYYTDISYEKGYEFMAYAKAGRVKEMWEFIYRVFGDWMEQGHTRFPENFLPEQTRHQQLAFYGRPYGLSLCHGANGVPVVVGVLQGLLGFSQSAEHPNEYTLSPNLLHLKWIHSRIPVKEGFITLILNARGESYIVLPEGCRVTLKSATNKPVTLKTAGEHRFRLS